MSYTRHYCYKITFDDGYVYFGVRSCRCPAADDSYMGSPVTHAAKWLTDMPRVKQIVSIHATRQLANGAEVKLILDFWAVDKALSLNAAVHGIGFNVQGVPKSAETKDKMSKPKSKQHTANMTASKIGVKHTAERKTKVSESKKMLVVCRHCGVTLNTGSHNIWHGDNCQSIASYILATYLATGETKEFKTASLAAASIGQRSSAIVRVMSGSSKHAKGWHFERIMLTNKGN